MEAGAGGKGSSQGEREKTGENPRNNAFQQDGGGPSGGSRVKTSVSILSSEAPSLR